jgi:hypothetical protein
VYQIGAHREGVLLTIAPSTRLTNRSTPVPEDRPVPRLEAIIALANLRDELAYINQNPLDLLDDSLYLELPPYQSVSRSRASSPAHSDIDLPSVLSLPDSPVPFGYPQRSYSLSPSTEQQSAKSRSPSPDLIILEPLPLHLPAQMVQDSMPARGEHAAPKFDKSKPRELSRFFDELEYLFPRIPTATETEKKKQVLRYVDFDIEQIWKTFPEYPNALATYLQFKDVILIHYPDASGDYVYSLRGSV